MSGSPIPAPTPLLGSKLIGGVYARAEVAFGANSDVTDPGDATIVVAADVFETRIQLDSGDLTITATPTMTNSSPEGRLLLLRNSHGSAFNLTVQDDGTLPGSKLRLSATAHVLTPGSSILFRWDNLAGFWFEIAKTILV